jgi:hypothetical protein
MKLAVAALFAVVGVLLPTSGIAQADPASSFHSYCQVEDTGGREIWVSQVFPTPAGVELMDTRMASDFHRHVATLGGSGNKICVTAVTRAAAEETRAKIAAIMGKRSFGIRVYDWHDVAWAPPAGAYASAAPPAAATAQLYCRFTDTDKHVLVTSPLFAQVLPPPSDGRRFQELNRYAADFGARAAAEHGVNAAGALCLASDTVAEADKSRTDYRASFPFSGIKKVDVAFTPSAAPAAGAPAAPATSAMPAAATRAAAAPSAASDDVEEDFWRRIASSTTAEDFDDYLAAYPLGRHAPVARLESRRLRRGGTSSSAASSHPPSTPASTDYPIDPTVADLVARGWFFAAPAGQGAPLSRSGKRIVNGSVPVSVTSTLQRLPGGNLCRIEVASVAGDSAPLTTEADGLTWVGFLPLSLRMKQSGSFGVIDSVFRLVSVDKTIRKPFPLVAGNIFTLAASFENMNASGASTRFGQEWNCRVGASAAASTTIPGMAGGQTEVACDMSFTGVKLPARHPVMVWYDAAGCFMEDPTR